MPGHDTPDATEPQPAGPADAASLRARLEALPLRAAVAFAVRCARRVAGLRRLEGLAAEGYAAGVEVSWAGWSGERAARAVGPATDYAAGTAVDALFAVRVARTAGREAEAAVRADLTALARLNLGRPGEPGQPIAWDDPRLGPLWPDGPPDWYAEAEAACRKLEDDLRRLQDPPPQELTEELKDWVWLQELEGRGELEAYRGGYVFAANRTIFGHGRRLSTSRPKAEKKAAERGVPPDRLVYYYLPPNL